MLNAYYIHTRAWRVTPMAAKNLVQQQACMVFPAVKRNCQRHTPYIELRYEEEH
jgi:hypothetical protein